MKVMAEEDDPNENVSRPKDEIAPITSHNNHRNEKKRKGMKPRSKRNRKRAKGGGVVQHSSNNNNKNRLDPNANVENEVEVQVVPLFWNQKDRRERVRIVKPYFFTFATFVKGRWEGRTVLDVYSSEFGSYPKSYYELAIQSGRILVNSKRVKPDHILRGGNEITHTVHRHEPAIAVSDTPDDDSYNEQNKQHESYMQNLIPVIHEDDDIIVVDKPSSIPIHPCGNYNFNSMFHILSTQNQTKKKLYTIHRLDRLTSGLVICAKSSKVAQDLGKCIMDRTCQKIYLARVRGKFPLNVHFQSLQYLCGEKEGELPSISFGEIISNISDHQNEKSNVIQDISDKSNQKQQRKREVHVSKCAIGYFVTNAANQIIPNSKSALENMFLECSSRTNLDHDQSLSSFQPFTLNLACPCRISSPKNGICEAGSFSHSTPYVKPAQTSFTPLLYDADSDTTIVQCRPITGRTHQIRLHLQFLGHPIANDPNYGGELWFADLEGKNACKCAEERMKEMDQRSGQCGHINEKEGDHDSAEKPEGAITTDIPASEKEILSAEKAAAESLNSTQNNIDLCENVDENKLNYEYLRKSCVWCRRSMGEERDNERITSEFMVRSPGIWLHALKYTFYENGIQQVSYNTKVPEWANPKRG